MDRTVPKGAAFLLDFIGGIEAPKGYDTIYGNNQGKLPKQITKMTLAELQDAQLGFTKSYKSSASGRYQFMRQTLQALINELSLNPSQKFDANLQDRLGYHLLRKRGYDAYVFGRITAVEFGKRLAQEWASLPVLASGPGAHRNVQAGETYYAGDKLNKSLVSVGAVLNVLERVKELHTEAPAAPIVKPAHKAAVAATASIASAGAVASVAVADPATTISTITGTIAALRPALEAMRGIVDIPLSAILAGSLGIIVTGVAFAVYQKYAK